jgi:hypothetical protein
MMCAAAANPSAKPISISMAFRDTLLSL